jgi:hypothetical protein
MLYGTTGSGGTFDYGVVFGLSLLDIVSVPQSQTAEVGASALFSTEATGSPPLTYQWFFNDSVPVSPLTTNGFLELPSVQPDQAGLYTVVITNTFGAVTSSPAMLGVIPAVERRSVPGLTLQAQSGSTLNLEYSAAIGPSLNWTALDQVALTNASQWYFDLSTPLPPSRFYRAWQTNATSVVPALRLNMIPAITLTGNFGDSLRLDCINCIGPTDAWVTLDTITLTNTSQLYFDTASIGQPPRLWRIVPLP